MPRKLIYGNKSEARKNPGVKKPILRNDSAVTMFATVGNNHRRPNHAIAILNAMDRHGTRKYSKK